MKVLIDTHVLLWSLIEPERLSDEAAELLLDSKIEKYFSVASSWEIGLKHGKGLLELPARPAECVPQAINDAGLITLPIKLLDTLLVSELPRHHGDPFDRIIAVQAKQNGMYVMSRDTIFSSYDVDLIEI